LLLALQKRGVAAETMLAMTLEQAHAQVATEEERQLLCAYLEKRKTMGIDLAACHLVSDEFGHTVADLGVHLRKIKTMATNAAANGEMCRMLVDARRQIACQVSPIHFVKKHPRSKVNKEKAP